MIYERPMWQKLTFISMTILLSIGVFLSLTFQIGQAQSEKATPSEENAAAFVDGGFNPVLGGGGFVNTIMETVIQPDGKILVSGTFNFINGANRNGIARFNADGTLDSSFNTGSGASDGVNGMSLQSDGKIIIGGVFTSFNGVPVGRIARLNPDGSLDLTFNTVGIGLNSNVGSNNTISEVKVLSDNKILIGGLFTNYNGTAQNRFARLNSNGSLDTSFVVGTGASLTVSTIDVQADGKAVIGGSFTTYNAVAAQRVARINTDGTIDTGFATASGANTTVNSVVVQSDGKILVGGNFATYGGVAQNGLARLNSDGTVDAGFNVSGTGASIFGIGVQTDGKLVVGGFFTEISGGTRSSLARLNANGTFDASFDPGTGISSANQVSDLALQTDGKVVLVGNFTTYNGVARGGIARANSDGSLDTSMPTTSASVGNVNVMVVQPDGKIVIGGLFSSVNGTARTNIARLNADGTLDTTFDTGTGTTNVVNAMAIQSDGKILIGGNFLTYNGTTVNRLARLNTNGTVDSSFTVGTGPATDVFTIAVQPSDGKILIGGLFTTYNTVTVNRIARLNTDGTLDTTFMTGSSSDSVVRSIVVQPDNKILFAGSFQNFNGSPRIRVARLNADGTLDPTFIPTGTGPNSTVLVMALQSDGKVLIGGTFTAFNAITRGRIARLNSDGSLDTGFDTGAGAGADVNAIIPLSNGKTLIAGNFVTVNNLPRNRVARLNANGSFDATFQTGFGANAAVRSMVTQSDGKILIGGIFPIYNVNARTGIARFSIVSDTFVDFNGDGKSDFGIIRRLGIFGDWAWWISESGTGNTRTFNFGFSPRDIPQPGDFDGDGKDDIAMWRNTPEVGQVSAYYIILSATNTLRIIPFGQTGDQPVMEDYDGDGKDDPSVWRAPNPTGQATWFYIGSLNNPNNNITYVPWGMRYGTQADQVDDPYAGDTDGDGKADFTIQRRADIAVPSSNTPAIFYTMTATGNISFQYFGWASDRIVPGDYDGDGKTDIAVARGFNISPGNTTWYIRYSSGIPDSATVYGRDFGFAQGDYDGDSKTDIGYFIWGETDNDSGFWYLSSANGQTSNFFRWGARPMGPAGSGDLPIAGYNNR